MCLTKVTSEKMDTNQVNSSTSTSSQRHAVLNDRMVSAVLPKYDAVSCDFNIFRQRFEDAMDLYQIDEIHKGAHLVAALDDTVYTIIVAFCEPMKPRGKTYRALIELLGSIFVFYPAYNNRRRFYDAKQLVDESVLDWYARIKKLAIDCSFGLNAISVLNDRFVCGLLPSHIFDRIAKELPNKALDEIVQLAILEEVKKQRARPLERSISIDFFDSDDEGYPSFNPGYNPGFNPGFNPGSNPGFNPGFNQGFTWLPSSSHAGLPPNSVYAGNDADGSPIYVGRAFHEGDQIPAKVIPSKQVAYISHAGQEIPKHQYEVLSGTGFTWVSSGNGHVPPGAVSAGNQSNGEPLFVGRAHFQGSLTPGKIHRSHGCLYIPFGGAEQSVQQYEVLIGQQKSNWVQSSAYGGVPEGAILAGNDADGTPIYVGRAFHEGDQIPAKVLPSKQVAYIAYNGQEIAKQQYEVLCNGNVTWVQSGHGSVPPNAVVGGRTSNGEPLYIGRTHFSGALTPGKVHPSHGSLYIPFGGAEIPFKSYEVLIEN